MSTTRRHTADVAIDGTAETPLDQSDERHSATTAIGRRYAGPDGIGGFRQLADASLNLLVRVRPTRILARDQA